MSRKVLFQAFSDQRFFSKRLFPREAGLATWHGLRQPCVLTWFCQHCVRRCFSAPCVLQLLSEDCGPLTVDPRDSLRSIIGLCVLSIYFLGATKQRDVGEIKILSHENSILISANRKNTLISCASKLLFYYVLGIKSFLRKSASAASGRFSSSLNFSFKAKSQLALL